MRNLDIIETTILDRENSFKGKKKSFVKKYCLDLIAKFLFLLVNSFGKDNIKNEEFSIFVDEIDNSSMRNNLIATIQLAERKDIKYRMLEFYRFNSGDNHLKIGYLKPIFLTIILFFEVFVAIISKIFRKETLSELIQYHLIKCFILYLKNLSSINKYYIMTDHHFYSSILAMIDEYNTYVIQHGLILDKRFYYPIRAKHFCAWGEHSKELLCNDPKVIVTGTKKFDDYLFHKNSINKTINKILYCISSLDNEAVSNKIRDIYEVVTEKGLSLNVKCHPGSMFDVNIWKKEFLDYHITFYKEEKLDEIDFDLAISENSTINIDFVCLRKPFIIFDNDIGYFDLYKDFLPVCKSKEELLYLLDNIDNIDYSAIEHSIIKNELNDNKCVIFDTEDTANEEKH